MALPAVNDISTASTQGVLKAAFEAWLAVEKQLLGAADESELTISSGSVTATGAMHTIDGESDAADTLTNIVVASISAQLILIRAENAARVITLSHEAGGAGQLSLKFGANLVLDATTQYVLFWVDTGASPVTLREVERFGFIAPSEIEANTAVAAGPNILTVGESGKTFTNEGIAAQNYHTLPLARAGLAFTFVVQDADGIRVVANAGDTIRVAASESGAAGFIQNSTIGSAVTLVAINATEWIATATVGTWTVDA